jgi:hypothetical protein
VVLKKQIDDRYELSLLAKLVFVFLFTCKGSPFTRARARHKDVRALECTFTRKLVVRGLASTPWASAHAGGPPMIRRTRRTVEPRRFELLTFSLQRRRSTS